MDYMTLLVTELQNQNPLEPLNNNEMASQLAQFQQLQQLETMNSSFAKVLTSVERAYASSLIGKEVSFPVETEQGTTDTQSGPVERVYNDVDGQVLLVVNGYAVGLDHVVSIKN
jgi:flagellar basal-body rod modification protein FlgD